jgi:uncharacterized membrane protein
MPGDETGEKLKVFSVEPSTARAMCYIPVFGIIAAVIFLIMEKNHNLRRDAVQATILWVMVFAAVFLLSASRILAGLIPLVNLAGVIVLPLFLAVKASQKEETKLPFLGEMVDKIVK